MPTLTLADVPRDPYSKVLHLCRYPEKCCAVCDRHRERCWHPIGRRAGDFPSPLARVTVMHLN